MQDHTFTLIVSAVGIGGALSGIIIGHFLTRSSQREQWVRDRKLEEYRQLISCVNEVCEELAKPHELIDLEKHGECLGRCFRTIDGCILIADEIEQFQLIQMILDAQRHAQLTDNVSGFGNDRKLLTSVVRHTDRLLFLAA